MTRATKTNATRFLHDTASFGDPIDDQLVADYLRHLGNANTDDNRAKAAAAIRRAYADTSDLNPAFGAD